MIAQLVAVAASSAVLFFIIGYVVRDSQIPFAELETLRAEGADRNER